MTRQIKDQYKNPYFSISKNMARPSIDRLILNILLFLTSLFLVLSFLSPSAYAKKVPIDGAANAFFENGSFIQTYPDVKLTGWTWDCDNWGNDGRECSTGSYKNTAFNQKIEPTRILVHVFATSEQAQDALDVYEKKLTASLTKKFKMEDQKKSNYADISDIKRELLNLTLPRVDSGFLRQYKYSHKKHVKDYKLEGVTTYESHRFIGAFRKGRVVYTIDKSLGAFEASVQGKYWSKKATWDPDTTKAHFQENENNKKIYALQASQTRDFIPKIIQYTPKIEDAWLAYYSEFKNQFLSGKDFADMGLAELVDLRAEKLSSKGFINLKKDMELRLNAMKKSDLMNPEFPSFFAEISASEKDPWRISQYQWYKQLKNHAATSQASELDFAPHWEALERNINTHYLHTVKNRLEKREKLSDTRLRRLRLGLILWGTGESTLQEVRDRQLDWYDPVKSMSKENLFEILAMTGHSSGIRDDAFLSVETHEKKIRADGKSTSRLIISLFNQTNTGSKIPLNGKTITLENVPFKGQPVGRLSHQKIETDTNGSAQVIYTAPDRVSLPEDSIPRAQIVVRCPDINLQETIYIDLFAEQQIQIKAKYDILPAQKTFTNELTFRFENPDKDWGKTYKTIIRTTSEHGRVLLLDQKTAQQELTLDATSGTDNTILYFWDGPQPADKAWEEKIQIEILELGLSETIQFSVGIDLVNDEAKLGWKPPFQPFLTIPVHVYIKDRFHPDADLEKLFSDFEIHPQLIVEQTGFSFPEAFATGSNGDDPLISAAGVFLERSTAGIHTPKSLTRNLMIGTVKKTKDNRWLLVSKDLSGEGVPIDQMFPAIIPFVRGTFQVSVSLDPKFKGDASSSDHTKNLSSIEVSRISAHQGELEYFLLPSLKAVAGFTPSGSLAFGLTDIALKTRSGDYKGAIISAGQMVAGKFLGDALGDKMKAGYKSAMNTFHKERIANALGTTVKSLHSKQTELALRLAYPYKLASWVETITGWAVDQTIGEISPSSYRYDPVYLSASSFFAQLGDLFIPSANAAQLPKQDLMDSTLKYLLLFIQGYGSEYGLIVLTRAGLDTVSARDQDGQSLKQAPDSVFAGKDPLEMIKNGKQVVVIPFKKGSRLTLDLSGRGVPVKLYKILDNKITKGILDYHGNPWNKKLNVNG